MSTVDWHPGLKLHLDPDAKLAYTWDWSGYLPTGVEIASHQVVSDGDINVVGSSASATEVTVLVDGAVAGSTASVTCRITTDADPAQTDDRTVHFEGREQ